MYFRRLTEKDDMGNYDLIDYGIRMPNHIERLGEYEELGYTPHELAEMLEILKQLKKFL